MFFSSTDVPGSRVDLKLKLCMLIEYGVRWMFMPNFLALARSALIPQYLISLVSDVTVKVWAFAIATTAAGLFQLLVRRSGTH